MEPREFIQGVRESIVKSNLNTYQALFNTKDNITDPYWINALSFFSSLNDEQKVVFFNIVRQVEVDTISSFLAILDGIKIIKGQNSDFKLTTISDDLVINGDLQDIFLELENS